MVNNFFFGKNFLNKVNTSNYLIKNHIKNTPLLYKKIDKIEIEYELLI
jgi:hypothetical protein